MDIDAVLVEEDEGICEESDVNIGDSMDTTTAGSPIKSAELGAGAPSSIFQTKVNVKGG